MLAIVRHRALVGAAFAGLLGGLIALAGCGETDCAEGTVRQDGRCVIAAEGCGPRTVLIDGVCVLEEEACDDAQLQDGVCVPDQSACSGSTVFDAAQGRCVPAGAAACGTGTILDANGQCIPTADACSYPTVYRDGFCVVGPESCEQGAALDPTTNTCIFEAPECADGLVYWDVPQQCRPTDEVCAPGTEYDTGSNLCVPDACDVGDVMLQGLCFPPEARDAFVWRVNHDEEGAAEEAAADEISLRSPGYASYKTGRFHAVSSNGTPRGDVRDRDYYVFEADALDRVNVGLFSYGYGPAYLEVTGPEGQTWRSTPRTLNHTAREIILPRSGTYTIEVGYDLAPSHPSYAGDEDWLYGLILVQDAWSAPSQTIDVSAPSTVDGQLATVDDNFYEIVGFDPERPIELSFLPRGLPETTRVRFFPGGGPGPEYEASYDALRHEVVATDRLYMLIDWSDRQEIPAEYRFEIRSTDTVLGGSLNPGESSTYTLSIEPFDRIRTEKVSTASTDRVFAEVIGPHGTKIAKSRLDENASSTVTAFGSGDHTVQLINKDLQAQSAQIRVVRTRPARIGLTSSPQQSATVYPTRDSVGSVVVDVGAHQWLELSGQCASVSTTVPFELVDASGEVLSRASSQLPCTPAGASVQVAVEPNRTYLIRFPSLSHVIDLTLSVPQPAHEVLHSPPSSTTISRYLTCSAGRSLSYEFQVQHAAPLEFEFGGMMSGGGFDFAVISQQGGAVASRLDGDLLRTELVPAGDYLLVAQCPQASFTGFNSLTARAKAWSSQDYGTLSAGSQSYVVQLGPSPPTQYRRFGAPQGSVLRFEVDNVSTTENAVEMAVHNGDAELLGGFEELNPRLFPSERQQLGFGFDSFIAAFREVSKDFDFIVTVEPGIDAGVIDEQESTVRLTNLDRDESKLVEFQITEPSLVYLTATGSGFPQGDFRLFDPEGELLHEDSGDESVVVTGGEPMPAGTYYIEIDPTFSVAGPMDLALRSIPADTLVSRDRFVPDGTTWLTQDLQVSGCGIAREVTVFVELDTHVGQGDSFDGGTVELELQHPNGRSVVLSEASGRSWDSTTALFGVDASATGNLDAFDHTGPDGTWTLQIRDSQHDHTHDLVRWGLWIDCV